MKKLASILFLSALILGVSCSNKVPGEELGDYRSTFCSSPDVTKSPTIDPAEFAAVIEESRKQLADNSGISVVLFDKTGVLSSYQSGPAHIGQGRSVNQDTAFYIASSTKSLVATTVLKLYEDGVVDLDVPNGQYLKNLHFDSWLLSEDKITLRHLLTHDTGISSKALEIRTSRTGEHGKATGRRWYAG